MIVRFLMAAMLFVLTMSTVSAQQLEMLPEWTGYKGAELRLPSEAELNFEPLAEVTWSGVRFKDQPDLYNDDQWTIVDPIYARHPIGDLLVFLYDAPWDSTMKQRVREANVLDEEAIFPVPFDRCQEESEALGFWVVARRTPDDARIGAEEASQLLVVEKHLLTFQR